MEQMQWRLWELPKKSIWFPMYIALGISQGIMPLISYTYASGNYKRMKEGLGFSLKAALGFLTVATIGYFAEGRFHYQNVYGQ